MRPLHVNTIIMERTFHLCYVSIITHIMPCQIFILLYFLCYLEVLYFWAHVFNTSTQEKHFTILTWINLIKMIHLIKHCRCNVIRRMKQIWFKACHHSSCLLSCFRGYRHFSGNPTASCIGGEDTSVIGRRKEDRSHRKTLNIITENTLWSV